MATKETLSEPTKCTEKNSERYCSACLKSGRTVDAGRYCVGCAALLCEQCLQHHDKFPPLQSHQIVDALEAESHPVRGDNPVECVRHYGQQVNSYCKDHDVVCCEICLTMNHRSCGNTKQITDIAKDASNNNEFRAAKFDIEQCLELVQQEMAERNKNIRNLDKKKDAILVKIGKSEDDMIKRIKDIAEQSREDVSAKHAEHVKAVKSDVNVLETVTPTLRKCKDKLEETGLSDSEMFVHVKNCESMASDVKNLVRKLYENWQQTELYYQLNQTLYNGILTANSFGDVVEETIDGAEFTAKFNRKFSIKLDNDTKDPEIMGICLMKDDTIVVTDYHNKRLKRLNKDGGVIDFIDLVGSPASLCQTGPEEVAAALREEKRVQFVSVGKVLSLAHSFETEQKCTGLSYDPESEELYVSCNDDTDAPSVNVYNRSGKLQRVYDEDETGAKLFSSPCQISLQPSSDTFFVSDNSVGVIAMSKTGKKLWTFTDNDLKRAWGLVKLPGRKLLVSGIFSRNILQLGTDGKKINEMICASRGLKFPVVAVFNRKNSTLLVGGKSDDMQEYAISISYKQLP